jgi:DNA-binding HxlR family transcriptional regulator
MSSIQIAILKAIQANDGKLSWYQLDRELTQRIGSVGPPAVSEALLPSLRELEQANLIATIAGHHPAQPLYSITAIGQQLL